MYRITVPGNGSNKYFKVRTSAIEHANIEAEGALEAKGYFDGVCLWQRRNLPDGSPEWCVVPASEWFGYREIGFTQDELTSLMTIATAAAGRTDTPGRPAALRKLKAAIGE